MKDFLSKINYSKILRKWSAYLSLVVILLYILTGYGITQYRTIEKLTFGLLSKQLSFKIHSFLIIPLIIFVGLHLFYSCGAVARIKSWFKKN